MDKKLNIEICKLERIAKEQLGLDFYPIQFNLVSPGYISQIASFGLPERFIHWDFGREYKKFNRGGGDMKILELVLNNNPAYAYLSKDNTYNENLFVIAHVMGHADFFKNNGNFKKLSQNMVDKAAVNAKIVDMLRVEYGEKIDEYLTSLLSVASSSINSLQYEYKKKENLFYYLYGHAGKNECYQKFLFDMIKEEFEYFDPIYRAQIANEGWATFAEFNILKENFNPQQWWDFARNFGLRPEVYKLGFEIYNSIYKENGWGKCLDVRMCCDDIAFVQSYLSQNIVNMLKMGFKKDSGKLEIANIDDVISTLVVQKQTKGCPIFTVDTENSEKSGSLYIFYECKPGEELDPLNPRNTAFFKQIYNLWRNDIIFEIYYPDSIKGKEYLYDPEDKIMRIL